MRKFNRETAGLPVDIRALIDNLSRCLKVPSDIERFNLEVRSLRIEADYSSFMHEWGHWLICDPTHGVIKHVSDNPAFSNAVIVRDAILAVGLLHKKAITERVSEVEWADAYFGTAVGQLLYRECGRLALQCAQQTIKFDYAARSGSSPDYVSNAESRVGYSLVYAADAAMYAVGYPVYPPAREAQIAAHSEQREKFFELIAFKKKKDSNEE